MDPLPRHILFASEDLQTFLIDVPASIAAAQDFGAEERLHEGDVALLASPPRTRPYPDTEPKSAKAQAKVSNHGLDATLHAIYQDLCASSVEILIAALPSGPFCLPRNTTLENIEPRRKRDHSPIPGVANATNPLGIIENATQCLQVVAKRLQEDDHGPVSLFSQLGHTELEPGWKLKHRLTDKLDIQAFQVAGWGTGVSMYNTCESAVNVEIEPSAGAIGEQKLCMRIPGGSSSLLGPCHDMLHFRHLARQYSHQGRFDLILMDPPWPNRSASRKRHGVGGYRTENSMRNVQQQLSKMDLDIHIKPGGFVAMWITNKASCRQVVMDLFLEWNVALVEEWVYLKLAANGEPITTLGGVWRKPYEVLLIAQSPLDRLQSAHEQPSIRRRTIAAVPDMHSRKPCLKRLFQALLLGPARGDQDVLEVFARHLVAQWMSWGDEVVKFNWSQHWSNLKIPVNSSP